MKSTATFYHAGCPVCAQAEQLLAAAIDPARYQVDVVHLGTEKRRVLEARAKGVESVPALVLGDQVFHINFGARLSDLG